MGHIYALLKICIIGKLHIKFRVSSSVYPSSNFPLSLFQRGLEKETINSIISQLSVCYLPGG